MGERQFSCTALQWWMVWMFLAQVESPNLLFGAVGRTLIAKVQAPTCLEAYPNNYVVKTRFYYSSLSFRRCVVLSASCGGTNAHQPSNSEVKTAFSEWNSAKRYVEFELRAANWRDT